MLPAFAAAQAWPVAAAGRNLSFPNGTRAPFAYLATDASITLATPPGCARAIDLDLVMEESGVAKQHCTKPKHCAPPSVSSATLQQRRWGKMLHGEAEDDPCAVRCTPVRPSAIKMHYEPLVRRAAPPCNTAANAAPPPELAVFLTLGPGRGTATVLSELLGALNSSGLAAAASRIVINPHDYELQAHDGGAPPTWQALLASLDARIAASVPMRKVTALRVKHPTPAFEFPTLFALWRHCAKRPDDAVLYMHTKGSTRVDSVAAWYAAWVRNLIHFTIHRYRDCVRHLRCGYSACGPNLDKRADGEAGAWLHYSGNFWCARCDYVRQLSPMHVERINMTTHAPTKPPQGRYLAEWWIGSLFDQRTHTLTRPVRFKNCWGQPTQFAEPWRRPNAPPKSRVTTAVSKQCRAQAPARDHPCESVWG